MIQKIQKGLELFNIKGGPLMGLWSLVMIVMTATGVKIDSGAVTAYIGALGVYGVSKGHQRWVESKVTKTMESGDV